MKSIAFANISPVILNYTLFDFRSKSEIVIYCLNDVVSFYFIE